MTWLSVADTALLLGCDELEVRSLAHQKRIRSFKRQGDWHFLPRDVAHFLRRHGK